MNWNETIQKMNSGEITFPTRRVAHVTGENFQQRPKEKPMPIYNDPNHPQYGRVRRLHLILLYLYGDDLERVEKAFEAVMDKPWDRYFIESDPFWMDEGGAASNVLKIITDVA